MSVYARRPILLARGPQASSWRRSSWAVAALLLTAGAFALRVSQMRQGLYGDEVSTYGDVVGHGLGAMIRNVHTGPENSPPLFFILAWLSARLGDPSTWIRLPSLLLGAATIPLLYAVGREAFDARAGLLAAGLLALSPFSLYYGVEARPYATMAFFVTLSTWALLHAVRTRHWRWWLLYTLAAAGAAYSHYTSVFVLLVQGVGGLWMCRDRMRQPLLAGLLAALLYLPWLVHVRGKFVQVIGLLHPLTARNVIIDLGSLVPGYPGAGLHSIPTLPAFYLFLACVVAGVCWRLRGIGARRASVAEQLSRPTAEAKVLIALLAFATPIGLLLYSELRTDLWLPRGLYASVPYICVLISAALSALPRRGLAVAATIVLAVLGLGAARALSPAFARPQYRQVASYLDRFAGARDPVIAPGLVAPALAVYLHGPHPLLNNSRFPWRTLPPTAVAWVVSEQDVLSRYLRVEVPRGAGLSLVTRRHYSGLSAITLLGYRRGPG